MLITGGRGPSGVCGTWAGPWAGSRLLKASSQSVTLSPNTKASLAAATCRRLQLTSLRFLCPWREQKGQRKAPCLEVRPTPWACCDYFSFWEEHQGQPRYCEEAAENKEACRCPGPSSPGKGWSEVHGMAPALMLAGHGGGLPPLSLRELAGPRCGSPESSTSPANLAPLNKLPSRFSRQSRVPSWLAGPH